MKTLSRLFGMLVFLVFLALGLAHWQQYAPATQTASGWLGYWRFAGQRGSAFLGKNGELFATVRVR